MKLLSPMIHRNQVNKIKIGVQQRPQSREKPKIIIQSGNVRTGSTVLVNLLYGFIIPDTHVKYFSGYIIPEISFNIYKSHALNLDKFIDKYSETCDLYFVLSERDSRITPYSTKQCKKLVIRYEEILETSTNDIPTIVNNLYDKLRAFLPNEIPLSKESATKRINDMNAEYEKIKDEGFNHINYFYHLHGSHRNPEITKNWPRIT